MKQYLRRVLNLVILLSLALAGCGGGGNKSVEPPTIRVVAGTVETGPAGTLAAAKDGAKLEAGATIKTGGDSRAGLFFTDGSQVMVEPNTEVSLSKGEGISLLLTNGSIWVASSEVTAKVDAGGPMISGTKVGFAIKKEDSKVTVSSVGGQTTFSAGGNDVTIASGQASTSDGNKAPSTPQATEVKSALRINIEGEALVYLADPSNRGVGYHPTREYPVSQIPNGWYSGEKSRPQIISVPNPEAGTYTILLVAAGNQAGWKIAVGTAGSDLVYAEKKTSSTITWGTPTGITLKISIGENGAPVIDEMSAIWTLYSDPPGKGAVNDDLKRKTILFGETAPTWIGK